MTDPRPMTRLVGVIFILFGATSIAAAAGRCGARHEEGSAQHRRS